MKQFRCGDVVPGCQTMIKGESDDQILEQVAEHARAEHGMDEVPPAVQDKVRSLIVEE